MYEIKCPECGSTIKMDENSYSNIIKQVRDKEFEEEINQRLALLEQDKQKSIELAVQNLRLQMQEASFRHEKKIQDLHSRLYTADAEKTMEINKIKHAYDKERDSFSYLLEQTKVNNEYDKKIAVTNATTKLKDSYEKLKSDLDKVELQASNKRTRRLD